MTKAVSHEKSLRNLLNALDKFNPSSFAECDGKMAKGDVKGCQCGWTGLSNAKLDARIGLKKMTKPTEPDFQEIKGKKMKILSGMVSLVSLFLSIWHNENGEYLRAIYELIWGVFMYFVTMRQYDD